MFGLLQSALRTKGKGLAIAFALLLWAGFALGFLLLIRTSSIAFGVPFVLAFALLLWPWMREFLKVFFLAVFGFYGGLFLLEVFLRLSYFGPDALWHPTRYGPYNALLESGAITPLDDPALLFGLQPGYQGSFMGHPLSINEQGFRDQNFQKERSQNTLRIMSFGTSITMGAGVSQEDAYPNVLGSLLQNTLQKPVESWNLGIGAYSVRQSFILAKRFAKTYSPDVIIVEIPPGGFTDSGILAGKDIGKKEPLPISYVERFSFAISAIYPPSSLRVRLRKLGEKFGILARPSVTQTSPSSTNPYHFVEGEIRSLAKISQEADCLFVLFFIRPMTNFQVKDLQKEARETLLQFAKDEGVLVVDSYPLFTSGELPDDFVVFPGDLHPNAISHKRFANALFQKIIPNISN